MLACPSPSRHGLRGKVGNGIPRKRTVRIEPERPQAEDARASSARGERGPKGVEGPRGGSRYGSVYMSTTAMTPRFSSFGQSPFPNIGVTSR